MNPDDIPIRGTVNADVPKKDYGEVKGNTDPKIGEDFRDAGKKIGVSREEQIEIQDEDFKAAHPFMAHVTRNWWKYGAAGGGAGLLMLLKSCA